MFNNRYQGLAQAMTQRRMPRQNMAFGQPFQQPQQNQGLFGVQPSQQAPATPPAPSFGSFGKPPDMAVGAPVPQTPPQSPVATPPAQGFTYPVEQPTATTAPGVTRMQQPNDWHTSPFMQPEGQGMGNVTRFRR